ncbi:MAG: UDP-N-acetylglucosamine 2-epimerase, partial [Planctomycetota bacterium]
FTGQSGIYGRLDPRSGEMKVFDAPKGRGPYGVLTLHRAASADDPETVARVLGAASRAGVPVLFPVHPRTVPSVGSAPPPVELSPPLPYLDFLGLLSAARFALTDSGGVQKEAYLLGVPCVTLRDATEWSETVEAGWNRLAGTDPGRILEALRAPPPGGARPALYGDGSAAERIADVLAMEARESE